MRRMSEEHLILTHAHEGDSIVAQVPAAHTSGGERHLIECHTVHFDCCWVLLLLKIDIAHVDA